MKGRYDIDPKNIEEAKKIPILTVRDSVAHHWLESQGFTMLQLIPNLDMAFKMLLGQRGDLVALDDSDIRGELQHYNIDLDMLAKTIHLFETQYYMALSRSTPTSVLKKIQHSFDELVQNGNLQLIE